MYDKSPNSPYMLTGLIPAVRLHVLSKLFKQSVNVTKDGSRVIEGGAFVMVAGFEADEVVKSAIVAEDAFEEVLLVKRLLVDTELFENDALARADAKKRKKKTILTEFPHRGVNEDKRESVGE